MSTNNKHKVSEKELDNLLGQAFLNLDFNNPKNQELMETISNQILPTKSVSNAFINKALFTKLIGVIAILATSAFIYFHYFSSNNKQANSIQLTNTISTTEQPLQQPKQESNLIITTTDTDKQKIISKENTSVIVQSETKVIAANTTHKHQSSYSIPYIEDNNKKQEDTNYVFPKLTDKEIRETIKQKEKMKNWLLKKSKDKYALIATYQDRYIYGSRSDSLSMFYMQNTEVSNLEYRTFLFDLLINDKKDDFLIAKPNQKLWQNTLNSTKYNYLTEVYFSDKKFDYYPVVNISPAGAELYCKWLSDMITPIKTHDEYIIARLPSEKEWILAAHGKFNSPYPWGFDSIQNKRGCYLANFCVQKRSNELRKNIECKTKNGSFAYNSADYILGDSMLITKVYSYNPNNYGLFCTSGNVSEMVYDNKTRIIKTKGGSWDSDFEECKIDAISETTAKASPKNGFRPIFRLFNKPFIGSIDRENKETGLPTLTAEEKQNNIKQKKLMIEKLIKNNKETYAFIPMGSCIYKKDTISVQAFFMQTTEVTNLEYKTFLIDLLINGRTEDYLIAKPDQEMWMKKFPYIFNDPMVEMYFSHPAYDEYPVVNISRKGAEMYCNWLTIETNKVLKENNKPLINDLRLPADLEWACAAKEYKPKTIYANGSNSLKDNKGKYTLNYMCVSKEQCHYDSVMQLYIPNEKGTGYIDDGVIFTTKVKSYPPNAYGLYCMAGNVAEMVNTYDKITNSYLKTGTKGGSWFSCDYFLEIDADDEFPNEVDASPLIGFRPVMTFLKTQ